MSVRGKKKPLRNVLTDVIGGFYTQKKARVSGELLWLVEGNSIALKSVFAISIYRTATLIEDLTGLLATISTL
jgi:hypothetical protein